MWSWFHFTDIMCRTYEPSKLSRYVIPCGPTTSSLGWFMSEVCLIVCNPGPPTYLPLAGWPWEDVEFFSNHHQLKQIQGGYVPCQDLDPLQPYSSSLSHQSPRVVGVHGRGVMVGSWPLAVQGLSPYSTNSCRGHILGALPFSSAVWQENVLIHPANSNIACMGKRSPSTVTWHLWTGWIFH